MDNGRDELTKNVENCEWLGVVGSPSTNNLFIIDLIEETYSRSLVGNFCIIKFEQDDNPTFAIGQIISINLTNPYLERHSIQKIISVRGEANPLTEHHDVRRVEMNIGAVYSLVENKLIPVNIGSVPSTGTRIFLLDQNVMNELISSYKDETFYVGKMYNTDILMPTIFRHFGKGEGGLGEAYHIGIFGKTGSGKSVLAKMLISAYAKHNSLSILIIDPMGEYAKEFTSNGKISVILKNMHRNFEVFKISEISLIDISSLKRILLFSGFIYDLGVRAERNQTFAADLIGRFFTYPRKFVSLIKGKELIGSLENAFDKEVFELLIRYIRENINKIYVDKKSKDRLINDLNDKNHIKTIYKKWKLITNLFSKKDDKVSIDNLIKKACEQKDIIILDLSEVSAEGLYWNEKVLAVILKDILFNVKKVGNENFKNEKLLNMLIMIDEAHRYAPRETPMDEDYKILKREFIDCIRTTRKYGIGWQFISQTLASLDNEIINQLRLYIFGYGLSWGGDLRVLRDIVGSGEHLSLYQNFRDPQTSAILGEKQYPFMFFGPVSPLSVSGSSLFLTALDYFKEFTKVNNL